MKKFNRTYSLSSLVLTGLGGFILGMLLMPERIAGPISSSSPGDGERSFFSFPSLTTPRMVSSQDPTRMDLSYVEFKDPPIKYKKAEAPARSRPGIFASFTSDYRREIDSLNGGFGGLFSSSGGVFGDNDDALYFGKAGGKRQFYGVSMKSSLLPPQLSWLSAFIPL